MNECEGAIGHLSQAPGRPDGFFPAPEPGALQSRRARTRFRSCLSTPFWRALLRQRRHAAQGKENGYDGA
jgi:hypothetical protein